MHLKRLFVGLLALALSLGGVGASWAAPPANISYTVGVCDPWFPTRCTQAGPFVPDTVATTTLSASDVSSSVALPGTGQTVIITNNGASDAYVKLGSSSVTATATSLYIKSGGAAVLLRQTATYVAGITGASGSASLVVVTGNGAPPSAGSAGGGSAITNYALETGGNLAGVKSDTAGILAGLSNPVPLAAGSALVGKFGFDQTTPGTTNNVTISTNVGTLPLVQATASAAISTTAAGGPTQLVAASGSTKIYVTHYDLVVSGAGTFAWVTGTGTNCGTGTAYLTGASGHPLSFAANGGIATGGGLGPILITGAGGELCYITTGAVDISGSVAYAQF